MKFLLFFSLGAVFAANTQAFWGEGFNLDVQNGVNVMHHGPGDMGNWKMAHQNDVGVMTMKHNGGHSMGVQIRNRLQLHWDPNQKRFVQKRKRSIEDDAQDAEVESTDKGLKDEENFSGVTADETTQKNINVDESDKESAEEPNRESGFTRHLFGGHKAVENSKAKEEPDKIYHMGSNGFLWRVIGGRKSAGDTNVGIEYAPEPGKTSGDGSVVAGVMSKGSGTAQGIAYGRSFGGPGIQGYGTGMAIAMSSK